MITVLSDRSLILYANSITISYSQTLLLAIPSLESDFACLRSHPEWFVITGQALSIPEL